MLVRLTLGIGVVISIFAFGDAFLNMQDGEPMALRSAESPNLSSRLLSTQKQPEKLLSQSRKTISTELATSFDENDPAKIVAKMRARIERTRDKPSKSNVAAKRVSAKFTPSVSTKPASLLEMIEQCFVSIATYTPVSGDGLKATQTSLDWENPKPFTGAGFELEGGLSELLYLNFKADTPSNDRRVCTVRMENLKPLGMESFHPEFASWWQNIRTDLGFAPLSVSKDAYWNEGDVVEKWKSNRPNARGCAINATYVERVSDRDTELSVVFAENQDECGAATATPKAKAVQINRLPQIAGN